MKLLVIATGGTIGSAYDGTAVNVSDSAASAVAQLYLKEHGDARIEVIRPLTILSENVDAEDFNTLAAAMYGADMERYDGVILTVGSDNLAYLAAFVGLLFGDRELPICLVASDKVLGAPGSNGYENFCCAVELIRQRRHGVFVPYKNSDGVMYVHAACDIRQADQSDDFFSFHGAYARYNGAFEALRGYVRHTVPAVFDKEHLPRLCGGVLMIHPYPMLDYTRLNTEGVRAVLHTLYHSATLDSGKAIAFLRSLGGVPMYLASFRSGRQRYQTAVDVIAAGAAPLCDLSPECAYMKLLLACSQQELSVRAFMEVEP